MISLLLHFLVIFSLHVYIQHLKANPKPVTSVLQVMLVAAPPKPILKREQKLLTTRTPAPVIVPQTAAPIPENTTASPPGEPIAGVGMLGAVVSPFNSFKPEGNAFFRERHAQQDAMRAYQEQMMAEQARYQSAQQSKMLIMQLNEVLEKQFSQEPIITGKCILNATNFHFECDSPALTRRASITERIYLNLFISLQKMGGQYNGFIVGKPPARPTVVLISEHQYP